MNLLKNLFRRRQRDEIGYVSDPERRAEDWSAAEMETEFARQVELGFPVGLYLDGNRSWMVRVLDGIRKIGRPVVVQADTGLLFSFQDPFKPDPDLLRLAGEGKIRLFFHLPFLFNLWLPFDASQVKWAGESVRVPLVRAHVEYLNAFVANIPEGPDLDMGFVVHAGYPRWPGESGKDGGYVPARGSVEDEAQVLGNRFGNNLAWLFDPFLGGLSRKGVRGRVLVENLVGSAGHPRHMATFVECGALVGGLDRSKYGLCWDAGHSWAAGEDLSPGDLSPSLECGDVGLVHMNGGPANVGFGSRVDLHGYTELRVAVGRGTAYPWLGDAAFRDVPMVFERKLYSVMLKDSAWLAEKWGQVGHHFTGDIKREAAFRNPAGD